MVEADIQSDSGFPRTLVNLFVKGHKTDSIIGYGFLSIGRMAREAKIEDLVIESERFENRGIGSALLKLMESVARERGVMGIMGDLSDVDKDHYEKLSYFYKKHGYSFTLNDGQSTASIFKGQITKQLR